MASFRRARPDDHAAFLALVPGLGVDDPAPGPDEWWSHMGPSTLVAEADGAVIAYCYYQALAGLGYVRHVVVGPDHRGRGLGQRLMTAVADRLRAVGCARWCLNVKPDNDPALRLYERLGLRVAHRSAALRIDWAAVAGLSGDLSLTTCPIDPAEDDALAAALRLPPGQIAQLRADPRRVNLRLVDPAAPHALGLGLAAFSPHFPGAFPFRVARPALARPLLEGMRPHARPEHAHVQLVVEDDDLLHDHLVAAGARVHLAFVHMTGPLPGPAE